MVVSDFLRKVESYGGDLSPYNPTRPSDIDVPAMVDEKVYGMILDVPAPIGAVVRDLVLLSKKYTKETGKDDWVAMPYQDNPALVHYLHDIGWLRGIVTIIDPPCPGQYVCLTNLGVERLVSHFPSNKYKQRK